jgi:hypothetical protein
MNLKHRSYGGKVFRPTPFIHEDNNLLVVASCWGPGDQTPTVVNEVVKYVTAAMGDVEVTSPFEYLTCLSDQANYLRIATLLANDLVFRGENRNEFVSGYELTVLLKSDKQLSWAQVGGPHILVGRQHRSLMPLTCQLDASNEMDSKLALPPMPVRLLGLEASCQIDCGDVKFNPGDQLVIAAASRLPKSIFLENDPAKLNLEKVTKWMIQESPESPFWLGLLDLDPYVGTSQ